MLHDKNLINAALMAGGITGLLSSIPVVNLVNCLLCGWVWAGALLGVWLYRRSDSTTLDSGKGALIGLSTGVVAAVVGIMFGFLLGGIGLGLVNLSDVGPAADYFGGLAASGLFNIIGGLFNIVFYALFGTLGGVIGAEVFKK